MQKFRERKLSYRLKQYMHVVWHDNEAVEEIAFAVEMPQGVCNNLRCLTIAKEAGAVSLIEPAFTVLDKSLLISAGGWRIPWLRRMSLPVRKLLFPLSAQRCRDRICKPEC